MKNIQRISPLLLFLFSMQQVHAWSCANPCPSNWFSGRGECLAWKEVRCVGSSDTSSGKGCGSGWNTKLVRDSYGGANFTSSCERHDACYETCGETHSGCDKEFRSDLKKECRSTYNHAVHTVQRNACLKLADGYYEAVRKMGGEAWREAQNKANCRETNQVAVPPTIQPYAQPPHNNTPAERPSNHHAILENILLTNTARHIGNGQWEWTAFITGPSDYLQSIRSVTYYLHPTFTPNVYSGNQHQQGHPFTATGWGVFELKANVVLNNGQQRMYTHMLRFQ